MAIGSEKASRQTSFWPRCRCQSYVVPIPCSNGFHANVNLMLFPSLARPKHNFPRGADIWGTYVWGGQRMGTT
eukprot:1159237-Pyramimonas_sp.AAC.1